MVDEATAMTRGQGLASLGTLRGAPGRRARETSHPRSEAGLTRPIARLSVTVLAASGMSSVLEALKRTAAE